MSIFREHKSIVDRAAGDRNRHKKKIEEAIKDSIKDVVAEESIIGQHGKKKIRIPVKGIKEYRFVYGDNQQKNVGSGGQHNVKRGHKINEKRAKSYKPGAPGNEEGEDKYEVEITLEELADYLFSDLELPELEKKKFKYLSENSIKRRGYRFEGIRPRLSKKETLKRKIKRKKRAIAAGTYNPEEEERFPFHKNDLKYHYMKTTPKENTAAVVFFVMDVSGSMTAERKYIARSYFFLLYQFLRHKYETIDVVFLSHSTSAKRVTEDEFFKKISSGGTMMSSALELEQSLIDKEYHPNSWNLYTFYCGDGENWSNDNERAISLFRSLKDINQMIVYTEIDETKTYSEETSGADWHMPALSSWKEDEPDSMWNLCYQLLDDKFKRAFITSPQRIWPTFNKIFGVKE